MSAARTPFDGYISYALAAAHRKVTQSLNTGLKKHGVQKKNEPGDLYVTLQITLPETLNSQLKDFVKNWDQRDETPQRT